MLTQNQRDTLEYLNSLMFRTDDQEQQMRRLLDIANQEGRVNYNMYRPYISFEPA
jgi:hypothetical protein